MQAFIVLGLIPGTNIQIGFLVLAVIAGIAIVVVLKRYLNNHRAVKQMVAQLTTRQPLPARAFHSRIELP